MPLVALSTEVVTGLFGLGGVLVGAGLSGWVAYLVERHKQKRVARAVAWQLMAETIRALNGVKRMRARDDW